MKDIVVTGSAEPRKLKISVLRFNPQEPGGVPRMQMHEIEEAEGMTLFIALNEIREKQDPSIQFDFVCRAGICGSCGMMINGRPRLACRTLTKNLESEISLRFGRHSAAQSKRGDHPPPLGYGRRQVSVGSQWTDLQARKIENLLQDPSPSISHFRGI